MSINDIKPTDLVRHNKEVGLTKPLERVNNNKAIAVYDKKDQLAIDKLKRQTDEDYYNEL